MGRYKEAEELFRKGLEIQPQASRFHTYLAMLDIVQNRPAQAMDNARLETEGFGRDYAVALVLQAQGDRKLRPRAPSGISSPRIQKAARFVLLRSTRNLKGARRDV